MGNYMGDRRGFPEVGGMGGGGVGTKLIFGLFGPSAATLEVEVSTLITST